jgi:hypothetical protein
MNNFIYIQTYKPTNLRENNKKEPQVRPKKHRLKVSFRVWSQVGEKRSVGCVGLQLIEIASQSWTALCRALPEGPVGLPETGSHK